MTSSMAMILALLCHMVIAIDLNYV
jgi:hypothetical protein